MKSDHLDRAKAYLAIAESGDSKREAYKAAAEEIAAAIDEGMTQAHVATGIGKSRTEVQRLLAWRKAGYRADTPYLMDERATHRAALSHTRAILRDAPMEQIERIIDELPDERKRDIGAAAGDSYLGMRQEHDERRAARTPAEIKAAEARREQIMSSARRSVAGLSVTLGVVASLDAAREELAELNADNAVTPEMARQIDTALDAFIEEFRFARALLGEEV